MIVTIETERLIIRPVVPDDAEAIFRWASDPEVTKYLIYSPHPNVQSTRAWLESLDHANEDSYDLGFESKETGELIGMGGIVYHKEEDVWMIGYNLRRDWWGNGIVPEAMRGIIDYVRERRPIRVLQGQFAVENNKSRRVMEKLGMQYYKDGEYTKMDGSATFKSQIYRREFS